MVDENSLVDRTWFYAAGAVEDLAGSGYVDEIDVDEIKDGAIRDNPGFEAPQCIEYDLMRRGAKEFRDNCGWIGNLLKRRGDLDSRARRVLASAASSAGNYLDN